MLATTTEVQITIIHQDQHALPWCRSTHPSQANQIHVNLQLPNAGKKQTQPAAGKAAAAMSG